MRICESSDFHRFLHSHKYKTGGFVFGIEEFTQQLKEITTPNYVPSIQHVLTSRVKTTGIVETEYTFDGCYFRVIDGMMVEKVEKNIYLK